MEIVICTIIAKTTYLLSRFLKIGSGHTWPGHLALFIFPNLLLNESLRFPKGVVLITGTNGKTTTASLLAHILRTASWRVVHNATGANLLGGVVSAILLDCDLFGRLRSEVGVFEVDELALPKILEKLPATVLVLLNLSRDQLDRLWEVDMVADGWKAAVVSVLAPFVLVVDSTQKRLIDIANGHAGAKSSFDDSPANLAKTALMEDYQAKNVNAAVVVAGCLGVSTELVDSALRTFSPVYGRGEVIDYKGKHIKILLAKNPSSFNLNLAEVVLNKFGAGALLFVLNDEVRDGRDVSWIYDIRADFLNRACFGKKVFVSGTRRLDMATRLLYADAEFLEADVVELRTAVEKIAGLSAIRNLYVLPNYSAMLEARKILTGKAIP